MEQDIENVEAVGTEFVAAPEDFTAKDWIQDTDGKWILSQEAKDRARALYFSCRVAYDPEDTRKFIGRYNEVGEVIPFKRWTD